MSVEITQIPRPRTPEVVERLPAGEVRIEPSCSSTEQRLLKALRAGDEEQFLRVVRAWWPAMVAVAARHVHGRAAAEDVVQDTWLGVLRGLERFEGRSSVRTWVFGILGNRARSAGVAEHRTVPFSEAFHDRNEERPEAAVPPDDRVAEGAAVMMSAAEMPDPEAVALVHELRGELQAAVRQLPNRQRAVVLLRDLDGLTTDEICGLLEVSSGNQRLLLHRARTRLRQELAASSPRARRSSLRTPMGRQQSATGARAGRVSLSNV